MFSTILASAEAWTFAGMVATGLCSVAAAAAANRTHREVRTNHGKRAGEYIEMMPEKVEKLNVKVGELQSQLAEHTLQDAQNFSALQQEILAMRQASMTV